MNKINVTMSILRNYLDKIRPHFEESGKLHAFKSIYDGMDTFLYVPNATSKSGTNIHDSIDSKRIMSMVVITLVPAMLFGMYNVGYQNYLAAGTLSSATFAEVFLFGFLAVLPKIIVSYAVGLGIEFAWAQWKGEEIQEGFLVSGILIPLIVPVNCPLWALAVAVAFAVVFAKEIFGGTGMNIFNVALVARAFLFFSYPTEMSGDTVWVAKDSIFGFGNQLPDAFTCATPLGAIDSGSAAQYSLCDMVLGLIPGSIGETSVSNSGGSCCVAMDRYCQLENDAECVCWRRSYRIIVQCVRDDSVAMVRASCAWRFRFRSGVHGDGSGDRCAYRGRQMGIRVHNRHAGCHYPRDESRLSGGNDAGRSFCQYVCSVDRLLRR